jgi:hypothetical protein
MEGMEMADKKITAEYVRANFPSCVEFADECRSVFGDGVRMVYAKEGGQEIGKQMPGNEVCMADVDLSALLTPEQLRRGGRGGK